jgi:hypothetical protein
LYDVREMQGKHEARIETLRTRRAQINAQLLRLEAISKTQARKDETRRKILAGAVLLDEMAKNPKLDAWARDLLKRRLLRDRDRALFGFDAERSE